MKILILTPINPIIAGVAYSKISNSFTDSPIKETSDFICYPFFAEMGARMHNKEYLPNLFAMMSAVTKSDTRAKIFTKRNSIVIGNSYKDEKFDIVVSLEYDENEVFDTYIESLKTDEDYQNFTKLLNLDNLYSPADAEINLPTIDHAILFLKEALKKDEPKKQNKLKR